MALQSRRRPAAGKALAAIALTASCAWLLPLRADFVAGNRGAGLEARAPAARHGQRVRTALAAAPTSVEDAKAQLMALIQQENLAQEVLTAEGKPTKGRVDEAIVQLERFNKEEEPAYSPKLDATWKVGYSGSYAPGVLSSPTRELALFLYGGGYSPGNALSSFVEGFWGKSLGLKFGEKTVTIMSGGRDVNSTADLEVLGHKEKLSYFAEIMPLSPFRFSEEVLTVQLPGPLGRQDLPFELRRNILITYLDEDTMIVRDESGVPDVLIRQMSQASHMEAKEEDTNATATETATLLEIMGSEAS